MVTVDPSSALAARVAPQRNAAVDLDPWVSEIVARVPDLMAQVWRDTRRRWSVDRDMQELVDDVEQLVGGKYLRPRLVALAYAGFGGRSDRVIDRLTTSVQSLHLALCIHDDVIDGDPVRHGRPTLQAAVADREIAAGRPADAERQGLAAGLLAGDLALTVSIREMMGAAGLVPNGTELVDELLAAIETAVAGEVLDVRGEQLPLSAGGAIRVAELKTAAYSIELPLRLGARAAGADRHALEQISAVGRNIGVAYQLVDDDLGVFGDSSVTGKSTGSDLRSGKRTELVRHAVTTAGPADRAYLEEWIGRPDADEATLDDLREILLRTGSRDHLHSLIDRHTGSATALITEHLPPWLGRRLIELIAGLRRRDS